MIVCVLAYSLEDFNHLLAVTLLFGFLYWISRTFLWLLNFWRNWGD